MSGNLLPAVCALYASIGGGRGPGMWLQIAFVAGVALVFVVRLVAGLRGR